MQHYGSTELRTQISEFRESAVAVTWKVRLTQQATEQRNSTCLWLNTKLNMNRVRLWEATRGQTKQKCWERITSGRL